MRLVIALALLTLAGPAVAEPTDIGGGFSADEDGSIHYPNGDILHPDGSWTTTHVQLEDGRWVTRGEAAGEEGGSTGNGQSYDAGHGSSDGGRGPK